MNLDLFSNTRFSGCDRKSNLANSRWLLFRTYVLLGLILSFWFPFSLPPSCPGGTEVEEFVSRLTGKAPACSAGDPGSLPGSGRSPGEGNGNPLQYFCLGNPMDGGSWWAIVHGVSKSQTRLNDFSFNWYTWWCQERTLSLHGRSSLGTHHCYHLSLFSARLIWRTTWELGGVFCWPSAPWLWPRWLPRGPLPGSPSPRHALNQRRALQRHVPHGSSQRCLGRGKFSFLCPVGGKWEPAVWEGWLRPSLLTPPHGLFCSPAAILGGCVGGLL